MHVVDRTRDLSRFGPSCVRRVRPPLDDHSQREQLCAVDAHDSKLILPNPPCLWALAAVGSALPVLPLFNTPGLSHTPAPVVLPTMHRMASVLLLLVALSSVPALRFRLGPRSSATSIEEVLMVKSPGVRVEEKFHVTKTGLKMQFLVAPLPIDSIEKEEPQQSRAMRLLTRLYEKTQDLVPAYDLPSREAVKPKQVPEPRSSTGPRPPLLFVHGSYHSSWCWAEHFLPYFSSLGYAVYAVSLRGTGPTGTPAPLSSTSSPLHLVIPYPLSLTPYASVLHTHIHSGRHGTQRRSLGADPRTR